MHGKFAKNICSAASSCLFILHLQQISGVTHCTAFAHISCLCTNSLPERTTSRQVVNAFHGLPSSLWHANVFLRLLLFLLLSSSGQKTRY